MDQGTRELEPRAAADARRVARREANPERESERLEREVDDSRARLGDLVLELERRGRKVRGPAIAIAAGAVALAIAGTIVWRRFYRRRSRARLVVFKDMCTRAAKHPERVATEPPNLGLKIVAAAGSAAAAAGARALMKRWIRA